MSLLGKGVLFSAGLAKGLLKCIRPVAVAAAGVTSATAVSFMHTVSASMSTHTAGGTGTPGSNIDVASSLSNIRLYRGAIPPFTEDAATDKIVSQDLWRDRSQVVAVLRRPQ